MTDISKPPPLTPRVCDRFFGDTVRRLRKRSGLSMGDLARVLKCSVVEVSAVETARALPWSADVIEQVAAYVGADARELHLAAADSMKVLRDSAGEPA